MTEIFISYAREDRALVERLSARLEAAGHLVWWDKRLAAGAAYLGETEARIKAADAVLVIWTEASCQSHWVLDEAAAGRDAGKLIPLRVGDTIPPLSFRQLHAIDLPSNARDGRAEGAAMTALLAALAGARSAPARLPAAITPVAATAPQQRKQVSRAAYLSFAIAAIAIAGAGIAVKSRFFPASAPSAMTDLVQIAVFPPDADDDPGSLGPALAANLDSALALAPWTSVAASRTVDSYAANGERDITRLARDIDVDYLVETSLRATGDKAQVTARLFSGETGSSVRSFTTETSSDQARSMPFALLLADAVWRGVYEVEAERVRGAPLNQLSARELIARALSGTYASWTEQGVRESINVLDFAVKKHPLNADILATAAQADITLSLIDVETAKDLRNAGEAKLAKAISLAPRSRWITGVAADIYYSTGRYRQAAEAYARLIEQGYALPAARARAADAAARVDGDFKAAIGAIEPMTLDLVSALQRSQSLAAAANMHAAGGDLGAGAELARKAVAAYPNNPDAVMAQMVLSLLADDEPALRDTVAAFCRAYPSFEFAREEQTTDLRAHLAGDGGEAWQAFVGRVIDAYKARAALIASACAG